MLAKPKVYMDSCCFIELALQVIGRNEPQRENDVWFVKQLLNAAHDDEIEVLTSTLSIAECQHAGGDISDEVRTLFKKFFTSGQYVFLVQDSVLVAEKARNLRWVHGLTFGGADSIHIASAMALNCEEFLTWDKQPHAHAKALNDLALAVRFPPIRTVFRIAIAKCLFENQAWFTVPKESTQWLKEPWHDRDVP